MNCRHCNCHLEHKFLDLGFAPPSNAYLNLADLDQPELYYPLKLQVCTHCWLVQTEDYAQADKLFAPDYAYFSSTSAGWLEHAKRYAGTMTEKLGLDANSFVIEVASNDGYLLKNFVEKGIPCLGIEPTASTAATAENLGIPVLREFFGEALGKRLAQDGKQADLIAGNNVYAHVPDINDFTRGLKEALKPTGTITLEFPHLMQLIEQTQFDTVYHEHFSYLSLYTVSRVFEQAGLRVFDVEELPTHGGSLRIFGCHCDDSRASSETTSSMLAKEDSNGLQTLAVYEDFQSRADQVKDELLNFLLSKKREGKSVVAYGAAAKGNTLLNYAGIKRDLLPMVFDAAESKQGKFMPGSHIPIMKPEILREMKPDFVLVLPWNIVEEVADHHSYIREWGGQFAIAVPEMAIWEEERANRIYYTKPSITELEVEYASDAARNGWGERCYEYIDRFEDAFKEHLGVKYAIATSSCTGALHMGMAALGIGPGDEVILADTNWIATAAPILHLGASPIFVDILPDSWCIDPDQAEAAITSRTKAIIAVHLYGNLCDMGRLLAIGKKHGIPVIEDAAEAIGSVYHGRRAGSMGKFGSFSFHGSKTLTTGEGGMFVTNDAGLHETVLTLSNHGRARNQSKQFWPDMVGFKYKMSNIQAAIGCAQIERIEELIDRKREILGLYKERIGALPGLSMNPEPSGVKIGAWMPTVVFATELGITSDMLQTGFSRDTIDARVFFHPLSNLPMFEDSPQNTIAWDIPGRSINLPSYHDLSTSDIERVVQVVQGLYA
jgi:dTDP-4-amino-4,6-dideoxygalactose transaminase